MKIKVPLFGQPMKAVMFDPNATVGAVIGANLYLPDGKTVVQAKDILNSYVSSNPTGPSSSISSTDDLPEGQFNQYFTARRAQDALAAIIANSPNITWVYVAGTSLTANTVQNIRTTDTPSWAQVLLGADPTTALQAATKQYVDAIAAGLSWKAPCLVATTANITLSGTQTIDGIAVTAGQRVLVMNQTTTANNGIYVCAAGAWSRATDMNTWAQVPNASVFVQEGTSHADQGFTCVSDPGGTLGTTAITFVQFNGGGGSSPLTTKGDIFAYSTANGRFPVGTDGYALFSDSTQPFGLKWNPIASGAANNVGAYASAPATPGAGQLYQCTDCPLEMIYDGTKWNYFSDDTVVGLPTALTTWVNQGGATVNTFGPFQAITAPVESGTLNLRARVKTLAASSNYTVTALIDLTHVPVANAFGGLCLYNSSTTAFHVVVICGRGSTSSGGTGLSETINVSKFSSPTAFSADYIQYPLANPGKIWMRIKDDGTNRITSISYDGFNWMVIHTVGRTDFLTPTSVGYVAVSNNAVFPSIAAILSFTETTPSQGKGHAAT